VIEGGYEGLVAKDPASPYLGGRTLRHPLDRPDATDACRKPFPPPNTGRVSPADIPSVDLMHATLVAGPFHRPGWAYEAKYDSWRMLVYKRGLGGEDLLGEVLGGVRLR